MIPAKQRLESILELLTPPKDQLLLQWRTNLLSVEKCGPAHPQKEDHDALLQMGPEERGDWCSVGINMARTGK